MAYLQLVLIPGSESYLAVVRERGSQLDAAIDSPILVLVLIFFCIKFARFSGDRNEFQFQIDLPLFVAECLSGIAAVDVCFVFG